MAEPPEGGGKVRSKRPHGAKPYARSEDSNKSLFRRMTDGVTSMILPSWLRRAPTNDDADAEADGDLNSDHQSSSDADLVNTVATSPAAENNFLLPSTARTATQPMTAIPMSDWRRQATTRDELLVDFAHRRSNSGSLSASSVISTDFEPWAESERLKNVGEKYSLPSSVASTSDNPGHLSAGVKETVPDNRSDCSDTSVSTSGCSSMIPHPDKREYQKEILQLTDTSLLQLSEKLTRSCLPTATARPPLHSSTPTLGSRRISTLDTFNISNNGLNKNSVDVSADKDNLYALWSDTTRVSEGSSHESLRNSTPHSKPQSRAMGNKPAFNVSAFGTPVLNDRSVLNESLISSPYYPGPTAFGGASSVQRRNKYQSCFPYEAPNKRRDVKVKPRNSVDVNSLDGMSSTARKILETLEKMSTPVKDAHKIPATKNYLDSLPSLSRSSVRRPKLSGLDHSNVRNGPPTNSLLTPSSSKTRLMFAQAPVMSASQSSNARSSLSAKPSLKSVAPAAPETNFSNKTNDSGKIKSSRVGRTHYTTKVKPEDEIEEQYELPNIPLPISSLPTFQFDLAAVKPNVAKTASSIATTVTTSLPTFDFCLPSLVDVVSNGKTSKPESDKRVKFTFSSPLKAVDSDEEMEEVVVSKPQTTSTMNFSSGSTPVMNFSSGSTTTLKLKTKPAEIESVSSFPVASEIKQKGSVMDILHSATGKESSTSLKSEKMGAETKRVKDCWSCTICLINNRLESDKCAACQTLKPGVSAEPIATTSISAVPSSSMGFGDKFKKPAGNWTCTECYVSNKIDADECVACTAPRSEPPKTPAMPTKTESNFGNKFKPAAGSWTCDTCLVPNVARDVKCIACESLKPGTIAAPPESKFKFGCGSSTPSSSISTGTTAFGGSSGFKFGSDVTPTTSSTFKFGGSTTTTTTAEAKFGSFGSSASTSEVKFGSQTSTTSEFKFGSSASTSQTATSSPGGFVFGSQTKKESDKSPSTFTFGATAVTQKTTAETDKPTIASSDSLSTIAVPVKELEQKTSESSTGFAFTTPKFSVTSEISTENKESENIPTNIFGSSSTLTMSETNKPSTQSPPTGSKRDGSEQIDVPPSKIASLATFPSSSFSAPSLSQGNLFGSPIVTTTTTSTTSNMFSTPKTLSASSFGSMSTTPFGGNTSQSLTNIFTPQSTLSPTTKALFGTFSTASSVFGTTSTNSVMSPTSSASVFQLPAATTTTFSTPAITTTSAFFGGLTSTTTVSAPSTFGSSKPIQFSFTPTTTATNAFGATVTTTASFAAPSAATNPLFAFGSHSTAKPIGGNIFGSQNTTATTTTGASTFNAFGSNINTNPTSNFAGFGAPRAAGSNPIPAFGTPATAPAPSNRFQFNSAPSFQFAESQPSTDGVFQFTGNHETPSQPEQAATFQFNQPPTPQAGYQFNAAANPNFNFGANVPPNPGSNIMNPTPSLPAFNTGSTFRYETPNNGSRQFRRATRRRK